MSTQKWVAIVAMLAVALWIGACSSPNPWPDLTAIPTLSQAGRGQLAPPLQGSENTSTSTPVGAGEGNAALGAPIYERHCSPCHGIEGQGVDAPRLRDSMYIQTASAEEIFVTIAEGHAGTEMPAWLQSEGGPLTDTDIYNTIAYLRTLRGSVSMPTFVPHAPELAPTPLPAGAPTPEPARPSMPGEAGPAATLAGDAAGGRIEFGPYCASCHGPEGVMGIPNPGSDDGSVPTLNPIDPTIASPDPRVFAVNVDLFIEHGSIPEGPNPLIMMPSFGDGGMLTDQQIAELIAYVLLINGVEEAQ
jgi:mono/diheme cytochrome c family protein